MLRRQHDQAGNRVGTIQMRRANFNRMNISGVSSPMLRVGSIGILVPVTGDEKGVVFDCTSYSSTADCSSRTLQYGLGLPQCLRQVT
jgi:hypothetical protein